MSNQSFTVRLYPPADAAMGEWTPQREAAALARCAKATPGEWVAGAGIYEGEVIATDFNASLSHICRDAEMDDRPDDLAFIAAARTDLPAAIAEIRRLRAPGAPLGVTIRGWAPDVAAEQWLARFDRRCSLAEIYAFESRTEPSPLGPGAWRVLRVALERRIRRHLEAGGRWQDLVGHLGPITAADIRPAALTVIAERELDAITPAAQAAGGTP